MTNMKDLRDQSCESRLAGLLAVHLVGQVLDEAYVIANAARETGEPWRQLLMMTNLRFFKTEEILNEDDIRASSMGEDGNKVSDNEEVVSTDLVVTSTPQKRLGETMKAGINLIGQGDVDFETQDPDFTHSTSMFINHLFDMSDVEKILMCDDNEFDMSDVEKILMCDDNEFILNESNNIPYQDMAKIIESYVNAALDRVFAKDMQENDLKTSSECSDYSCYSFLSDAFVADVGKDVPLFVEDGVPKIKETAEVEVNVKIIRKLTMIENKEENEIPSKNDTTLYENAYLSLNRDYEQCSEEEIVPVLEDPSVVPLQEVELMIADISKELLPEREEPQILKELVATSAVSTSASSRKSSLVNRCRVHGARFIACLRGWWRRKNSSKRKDSRIFGSIRGLSLPTCPLSPDARRRATSMIDQRRLQSPSSSRAIVWKFNTVNEALVNSSRWKEYTFDVKPDECGEF